MLQVDESLQFNQIDVTMVSFRGDLKTSAITCLYLP